MAAQLAHEINQPLAAIVNFASGLARWLERPASSTSRRRSTSTDQISREALRAADVVQRLREFVRKEAPAEGALRPHGTWWATRPGSSSPRPPRGVAHPSCGRRAAAVEIDRIQIEQVVLNLLHNALEAMHERVAATRAVVVQTVATTDGRVEVRVRDDGAGLPAGDVHALFEPFFTTKATVSAWASRSARRSSRRTAERCGERQPRGRCDVRVHAPAGAPVAKLRLALSAGPAPRRERTKP